MPNGNHFTVEGLNQKSLQFGSQVKFAILLSVSVIGMSLKTFTQKREIIWNYNG